MSRMMNLRTSAIRMLSAVVLPLWAGTLLPVSAQSDPHKVWDWKIPGELYKELNLIHRAQIDKAAKLFEEGHQPLRRHHGNNPKQRKELVKFFKASALEWQKVRVQIGDSLDDSTLAYVIFMEGHSNHWAYTRNQAIRSYTEILDYFPGEIWLAVPALWFRADAHFENGDDLLGFKSLQEIAKDEDYLKHPLAAGAIRRLADNHWANQQFDLAAKYWLTAWDSYHKTNREEAGKAANLLLGHYILQHKFAEFEALTTRIAEDTRDLIPVEALAKEIGQAQAKMKDQNGWSDWYYHRFFNDSKALMLLDRDRKALYEWLKGRAGVFGEAGRLGLFYETRIRFAMEHKLDQPGPLMKKFIEQLKLMKDKPDESVRLGSSVMGSFARSGHKNEASQVFGHISGTLRGSGMTPEEKQSAAQLLLRSTCRMGMVTEARSLLDLFTDGLQALWAEYEIGEQSGDWPAALKTLDKIEGMNNPAALARARELRANIYHQHTREYAKAIEVYRTIAKPPGTLWNIQDCYRKLGKTPEAINTLDEIAGMFDSDAPKAVFTKAEYYRADGEHKLAVALYRQILQRFKKSGQSSQAHQRLEDYGIKTGGGEITELE